MTLSTQDIVEIHQLIALYGHAADAPDQEQLAHVFTEDAVFQSNASGLRFEGVEAIRGWFAEGKPPHPPAHQTTNVYVYTDGDTVRVRSKYLVINPTSGMPRSGDYEDVVVRTPGGWRIRERVSTDRVGGWVFRS